MRNQNKNTNKKASPGRNKKEQNKDANKKDLCPFIMKIAGKRPTCLNFVSERLSQQHVMNHFEHHREFIEEKHSTLATANWAVMFSV